jgi:hypothetical protein
MLTVAGETNPLPSIATSTLNAPSGSWPGVREVIVRGAAGTTALEGAEGGPVPTALVAVTVNV